MYHAFTVCYRRTHVAGEAPSRSSAARHSVGSEADIRASDADRDGVAEQLREHAASGRLSVDELDERLEVVFAARTLGELERPLADLPRAESRRTLSPSTSAPFFGFAPLLGVAAILVAVWALSGAGSFWPIWVLLGLWWFGPLRRRHRSEHSGRGPGQRIQAERLAPRL